MNDDSEPKDSILGILKAAIDIEKFGIRYYSALGSAIDNENGKALLTYLANAEEKHQLMLEDEYHKQKQIGDEAEQPLPLDNLDEEGRLVIFAEPFEDVDPKDITEIEAINIGLRIEERSMRFYDNVAKIHYLFLRVYADKQFFNLTNADSVPGYQASFSNINVRALENNTTVVVYNRILSDETGSMKYARFNGTTAEIGMLTNLESDELSFPSLASNGHGRGLYCYNHFQTADPIEKNNIMW